VVQCITPLRNEKTYKEWTIIAGIGGINMAFDKNLDKELFAERAELETTKLTVGVFSYNDGTPKMQISRENLDNNSGQWRWSKLGRMTEDEVAAVLPIMQKALPKMKEYEEQIEKEKAEVQG